MSNFIPQCNRPTVRQLRTTSGSHLKSSKFFNHIEDITQNFALKDRNMITLQSRYYYKYALLIKEIETDTPSRCHLGS